MLLVTMHHARKNVDSVQDDLEYLRHTSEKERWNLTSQLAQKEEIIRHLEERIAVLTHRTEADCQALGAQLSADERVRGLIAERALLERRLEEAHIHLSEIKTSWSNKISTLETQTKSRKDEEDAGKYEKLTTKVEMLSKENGALRMANEESRRILDESLSEEKAKNSELHLEIARLKKYLEELATALEEEKRVKDQTLLRNAEISQMTQLAQQELKQQQSQNEELFKKMSVLEEQLKQAQKDMKKFQSDKSIDNTDKLNERVQELENEVSDKNNSIRILQQNLADVKKSFQSELNDSIQANKMNNNCAQLEDINFKYMKHVLIKFLTSSEYEAQQLTKAVATLLKLNSDEERLIKETLEWRSSWFRSKPRIKLLSNPS